MVVILIGDRGLRENVISVIMLANFLHQPRVQDPSFVLRHKQICSVKAAKCTKKTMTWARAALARHTSILTAQHAGWILRGNETQVRMGLPNAFENLACRILALIPSPSSAQRRSRHPCASTVPHRNPFPIGSKILHSVGRFAD